VTRIAKTLLIAAVLAALVAPAASPGDGPVTKQNGQTALFNDFTPICAVPGYANYGNCGGSTATYEGVRGRINAVQAKVGRWNLGLSFSGLEPGRYYKLWGNRRPDTPIPGVVEGWFAIGVGVADEGGRLSFGYQTTDPSFLGFDLNVLDHANDFGGITVTTSYWSTQRIEVLNPDGTLYVPSG
jgi:hypothetical protein